MRDLRDVLLETDQEFGQLAARHQELEGRLRELSGKPYLSESDQLEEVTLKKRKLQVKDRMEEIVRRHQQDDAHPPLVEPVGAHHQPRG